MDANIVTDFKSEEQLFFEWLWNPEPLELQSAKEITHNLDSLAHQNSLFDAHYEPFVGSSMAIDLISSQLPPLPNLNLEFQSFDVFNWLDRYLSPNCITNVPLPPPPTTQEPKPPLLQQVVSDCNGNQSIGDSWSEKLSKTDGGSRGSSSLNLEFQSSDDFNLFDHYFCPKSIINVPPPPPPTPQEAKPPLLQQVVSDCNGNQTIGDSWSERLSKTDGESVGSSSSRTADEDGKRKCSRRAKTIEIELDEIKKHFNLPITKAAKEMKVGLTVLKKRCRELDIKRWPHRKIKSLASLIENVKELGLTRDLEILEEHKRLMEKLPEVELTENTKKLRQACFKAMYKKRRSSSLAADSCSCLTYHIN
ncbi:uncharacterized protein LOC122666083 [Telopea speciosissima]|uniref:uncharacterized protein LOC122666083 n=1 Tax=Telopea speciosissima TaxID=54955 RepID=UPI001CC5C322|nr:uncharacterized protein LOC122666083 [Telopea speciosissima]